MKAFFDPLASGARLRRVLHALPEVAVSSVHIHEPIALNIDVNRWLLTPEGRVLMAALSAQPQDADSMTLKAQAFHDAQDMLVALYRDWSQQKLRSVVALQRGEGEPLRAQGIAAILFLLVNGSLGREHAICRPDDRDAFKVVDRAIKEVLAAFVIRITESNVDERPVNLDAFSIYSGYALSEAARRLGGDLVNEKGAIFLRPGSAERVEARLYRELARRDATEKDRVISAFVEMRQQYSKAKPVLAAYRMTFERPSDTDDLQCRLASAVKPA
ncbi:hypothetical protein ABZS35_02310 [Micromonospora sp. NPDC005599]|uniref:hypothetical protein n=1 Tax=unclassified Micromonospora TaxID=2617518 RepID=UPI0033A05D8B